MTYLKSLTNNYYISPYLFIYKTQFTSFFSILMRVSGFIIFIYYFLIILNIHPFNFLYIFNFYNFFINNLILLNTKIANSNLIFIIFFIFYHLLFGIRYIVSINYWNNLTFNKLLNLKIFYNLAFLLSLTIIFMIFIITNFF